MKNNREIITKYWTSLEKHPALDRAINVLNHEILFGPDASTLEGQEMICAFIEHNWPEIPGILIFDQDGELTDHTEESLYEENYGEYYQYYLTEELEADPTEYSDYWYEEQDMTLLAKEPEKYTYQDPSTKSWYVFNEEHFIRDFDRNYVPDYSDYTFLGAHDIAEHVLRHASEYVNV
jgi:hypothetical protein